MPESLRFQLELVDRMTKPGKEAEAQMKKLRLQLAAGTQALKQTEAAMKKLQSAKVVDIATYKQLNTQLAHQKAAVSGFQQSILDLQGNITQGKPEIEGFSEALGTLGGIFATVAVAAGALAGAVLFGGAKMAIEANELKNDTIDALDAFLGSAEAAQSVYDRVNAIQETVAISQARGLGLARELSAAGVTNADALTNAVKSIGEVESVLGAGAGSKIQNIIERSTAGGKFKFSVKQLAGTGVQASTVAQALGITPAQMDAQIKAGTISAERGIAALTQAIDSKFSGAAGKQVLDLGAQFQKFKDDTSRLFADVNTEGFLKALHQLLSLFDQNTATGKMLHTVITAVFNTVFDLAARAIPYLIYGFKQVVIWGLQGYIFIRQLYKQLDDAGVIDKFVTGIKTVGVVLGVVIGVMVAVGAATLGLAIAVNAAMVAAIGAVVSGVGWIMDQLGSLWDYVSGLASQFYDAGANIIGGLINGIKAGGSAAVDSVKNIANDALDSFKGAFGIHSPSRVMAEAGGHMMDGLSLGLDRGAPAANDTLSAAVAPPVANGGGSGGGSVSITIAPGAIVISGVQGAEQLKEELPGIIANLFEQMAMQTGAAA